MEHKTSEEQIRICPKCGAEKKLRSAGRGRNKQWVCQACHLASLKTIYKCSMVAAIKRYQKSPKGRECRLRAAEEECGVRSCTSRYSKRSEKKATNAQQPWTVSDEDVLMSGKYTEGELAALLGRSIRAIQARKRWLREKRRMEI